MEKEQTPGETGPEKGAETGTKTVAEPGRKKASPGGVLMGGGAALAAVLLLFGYWSLQTEKLAPAPGAESGAAEKAGAAEQPATGVSAPAGDEASGQAAPSGGATPGEATPEETTSSEPADVVTYDLLRAAPDGAITLAGHAEPGAKVEVLIDGALVDTVTAGADGSFVSLESGAPSAGARQLSVRVTGADGIPHLAGQSLTVAPSPDAVAAAGRAAGEAPEQVAAAVGAARQLAATPIVSDAGGARVLAGASADLVVDTLSFDAKGRVAISGRGAPEGSVLRAYVDNAESGLAAPGPEGAWRMALPAPAQAGTHVLRVDALDAAGKVLGRAEQDFSTAAPEAAVASGSAGKGAAPRMITISEGETLWAIARDTYGDPMLYVRVFEANRDQIRDPDLIYPGQVFNLPKIGAQPEK